MNTYNLSFYHKNEIEMGDGLSMDYLSKKNLEMERAQGVIDRLNCSKNPYINHKHSRAIVDLKQMLESSVNLYGDNVAFWQKFKKNEAFKGITYKEAFADINGLGTSLIFRGLKDKRIAVIGENCYQWATSYLAAVCGVGEVVPLDKELSSRDLKQLVIEAEAAAVLFSNKYEEMFLEMKASGDTSIETLVNFNRAEHLCNAESHTESAVENGNSSLEDNEAIVISWSKLIEEGKTLINAGNREFLDAEIDSDKMSILLFTSGTTGISKGVMLSHRNICENLMTAPTILNVNTWDVFFSILPVHHTYECTCGFLMPLYKGASIAYCEGLKYIQKNLQEVRPTMILGVPLIFESLYKNIMKNIRKQGKESIVKKVLAINRVTKKIGIDLNKKLLKDIYKVFGGRMRVLISGGAAIDPDILGFFNDLGFIAVQGYGLTECSPMAALNPDIHKYMRNKSVGHVLPEMEVKIENPDEEGVGEICFKGPNIMLGYYNMPEETAKVLRDGWFYTGDLGYKDDENFVYITGRKKNVIITKNGKNVFPEELEYFLGRVPYVSESMVWAPESDTGQDISIVATIKPDMDEIKEALIAKSPENELSDEEIQISDIEVLLWEEVDKINKDLPLFKRIKKINVRLEDFEKTTGKKIKRFVSENKGE